MRKSSLGRVLLVVILGLTLGGCACMPQKAKPEPTPIVRQPEAPPRAPEPVRPLPPPPPKPERN